MTVTDNAAPLDVIDLDQLDATSPGLVLVDPADAELVSPLSRDEAQQLTNQIRSASEVLWVFLLRAHEGRAWEALGYARWDAYVKAEFDISRSHAYRLLDAARMERDITKALPEGADFRITEKAARDLKDIAREVIDDIGERTAGMPPDLAGEIAQEVINDKRQQLREAATPPARPPLPEGYVPSGLGGGYTPPAVPEVDLEVDEVALRRATTAAYDMVHSITTLSSMPDVDEVIAAIPVERRYQLNAALPQAVAWFNRFHEAWTRAEWQNAAANAQAAADDDDDELDG